MAMIGILEQNMVIMTTAIVRNTIISGVSSFISTPDLLAAKLLNYSNKAAFSVNNIKDFVIVGDDVQCNIVLGYTLKSSAFGGSSLITRYVDNGNYCKDIGTSAFQDAVNLTLLKLDGVVELSGSYIIRGCVNLPKVEFPNCLKITGNTFYGNGNGSTLFYLPKCVQYKNTLGNDNVFYNITKNASTIYADPSMETINAGAEEGDLAYARNTRNAAIAYVADFTAPNPITDLSIGNVSGTAIQFNFSSPLGSTNAIDYYELYMDGVYLKKIISGDNITGLSLDTPYSFEVKPIDIYYNKSSSNIVAQTTSATYVIDTPFASYRLNNNFNDEIAANNATNFGATLTTINKLGGYSAYFTTNDYIQLGTGTAFDYMYFNPTNKFTTSCWFKGDASPSADGVIIGYGGGTGSGANFALFYDFEAQNLQVLANGAYTTIQSTLDINWHHCAITWDGTNGYAYFDGVKIPLNIGSAAKQATYGDALFIGRTSSSSAVQFYSGYIDQVDVWNNTFPDIEGLWNNGAGIEI